MTSPTIDPEYQQYLAFKQAQAQAQAGGQPIPTPADERPPVHWVDVLKHLVTMAPLASQEVERTYHAVLDDFRTAWENLVNDVKTPAPAPASAPQTPPTGSAPSE